MYYVNDVESENAGGRHPGENPDVTNIFCGTSRSIFSGSRSCWYDMAFTHGDGVLLDVYTLKSRV